VGGEYTKVLVPPPQATVRTFTTLANSIVARGQGLFVPIFAPTGTGKTTFANSLSSFPMFASTFGRSIPYTGSIDFNSLNEAVARELSTTSADDNRILTVNLDHRESNPPTQEELSTIKRFLRYPSLGHRCLLVWPETNETVARDIARRYLEIAGSSVVNLPVMLEGPPRDEWQSIALHTLEVCNPIPDVAELADPRTLKVGHFATLGAFLEGVSNSVAREITRILEATTRPLSLAILFASLSNRSGVLTELAGGKHYGLLDASRLLNATRESVIGQWWEGHRGLLTRSIVALDARVLCLPPATSIAILREYGDAGLRQALADLKVRKGPADMRERLDASELGQFLRGRLLPTFEYRAHPPPIAGPAFAELAKRGFTTGKDKVLNRAVASAIDDYLRRGSIGFERVSAEERLEFAPLIPDNAIYFAQNVRCLEFTWRSTDYLVPRNRSEIAIYVLDKLKNYARELGWVGSTE